jgi:hypothetical protein
MGGEVVDWGGEMGSTILLARGNQCNKTLSDFRQMSGQPLNKMELMVLWEGIDNKPSRSKHSLQMGRLCMRLSTCFTLSTGEARGEGEMVAAGQGVQLLSRRERESQSM